jgi:glycosyltransferase involved in cell wall biosynthesis
LCDFYPEIAHSALLAEAVAKAGADVLFVPWTEWVTALCSAIGIPKFAYYGNPDAKSAMARLDFARRHGEIGWPRFLWHRRVLREFEAIHVAEMMRYDIIGDVAKNDADYYARKGHPNSSYIQNVWIDRLGARWEAARRESKSTGLPVIIGNVGKLGGTANTLGLELLGRDLLPALDRRRNGRPIEVRILGAGTPHPAVAAALNRPEVRVCGFVPDIDQELLSSDVFLCMNNASTYKVGHTRYLHAWSLGCCVIAHRDCALSMPEIHHGENALLGDSAEEIADLVMRAVEDPDLRNAIGAGGYRTFRGFFLAPAVAPKIVQKIRELLEKHTRSASDGKHSVSG